MCDQQSLRSARAYVQSDQSLCWSLNYSMIVKLLTEHHLEFLRLKGGCRGSSEFTHVKMPHCWKFHYMFIPGPDTTTRDTTKTSTTAASTYRCSAYIPNGKIWSNCSRSPLSRCRYTCNSGCKPFFDSLICYENYGWASQRLACSCSGNSMI